MWYNVSIHMCLSLSKFRECKLPHNYIRRSFKMTKKELRHETYLQRGYTVFKDAREYNDNVVSASYRLLKEVVPANQIKANCAYIFDMQRARTVIDKKYDDVLDLLYYMDLPYAEVARRTGLSVDRVHRLEQKGISQLLKHSNIFLV